MKWQGKECHLFYPTLHFLTAVCLMEYGNRSREHSASFEPISIAAQRIDLVLQKGDLRIFSKLLASQFAQLTRRNAARKA